MTKTKKLSIEDVKHIAKLAKLELSDEEIEKYRLQLTDIMGLIDKLQELVTKKEKMTAQVTGLTNIFRDDVIDSTRQLTQEQALRNGSRTHNGFFVVPPVLEQ